MEAHSFAGESERWVVDIAVGTRRGVPPSFPDRYFYPSRGVDGGWWMMDDG